MNLYLKSGYLNQEEIQRVADRNHINFIVQIGGRQVGKTYGCLQLMLRQKKTFILMRRTATEQEFICNDINNPFTCFKEYSISIKKDTKYTAAIHKIEEGSDPIYTGSIMALSTVAKIRGFNGSIYSDLIFDEFIPENHVMKIKDEGDAFLNAYVTISGAREENGGDPLRCWLLANPNTINSPILQALNIAQKVEEMDIKGQEVSILADRGIMIIRPNSESIMAKRKKTALFRAVGSDSKFADMALENEFSYNDFSDIVKSVPLSEYRYVMKVNDVCVYLHRNEQLYYCCSHANGSPKKVYENKKQDIILLNRNYPHLRKAYIMHKVIFSDQVVKSKILDMIF